MAVTRRFEIVGANGLDLARIVGARAFRVAGFFIQSRSY